MANGSEAALVEVPVREEEEGAGERDRVELVQRQPLGRRVEQVDEPEPEARPLAVEVLRREPVDREGAERDHDRLDGEQHLRARPDPPERRERGEDGVEMRGQAGDLDAVAARHLEEVAVGGVPDRLHHVPEVVPPGVERPVAEDRERGEPGRVRGDRRPEQNLWLHSTDSIRLRHRAPSTFSLACAW